MEGKAHLTRSSVALLTVLGALLVAAFASLALGTQPLGLSAVWSALVRPDGSEAAVIVRELRMPRTVLGAVVGAVLGLAGALMQSVTRNPLAEPGLFGVNAGAALCVVIALRSGVADSVGATVWWALLGALTATSVVLLLAARRGAETTSPVTLAVFGAAISAGLAAITSALVLLDERTMDGYRFWAVGSLAGRGSDVTGQILPFALVGLVLAVACARALDVVALGDEVAASMGVRVARLRGRAVLAIGLLTAAGVAACGPIAFLGLLVAHGARALVGSRHGWLLPLSSLLGAATLLAADTAGRLVAGVGELQAGVVLGLIGGPFFVLVVARRRLAL